MKHVLFVDDEAQILEGLRARFDGRRYKWAMYFAESAGAAIEELHRYPYDLVVADVHMAGMDGTRLLQTAADRWPQTIRVAMSGHLDRGEAMRLVPVAHQFLAKPCESQVLENTVDRCLALQELLNDPDLRATIGRMRRLPTLPATHLKLRALLQDEQVETHDVAELIGADTVVAAKVVQVANSAFFRSRSRITSLEQAITRLGFGTICSLVLSAEVFSQWPQPSAVGIIDLERLQEHTHQVVAIVSALTAPSRRNDRPGRGTGAEFMAMQMHDDAVLAALLHDLGYWLLVHECPAELEKARVCALTEGVPLDHAERLIIGTSHATIGAYLLGIWGLPHAVLEAVAHHHTPERVPHASFNALAALAIAHALAPLHDSDAFREPAPAEAHVTPDYPASVCAPFTWEEAVERAAECA